MPLPTQATRTARTFELVHPLVILGFLSAILTLTMLGMHPVLLALSLTGALAFSLFARGVRPTLRLLAWQVPLVVLAALINPLFSSVGSTELARIGSHAIYAESVVYGACMGLMLVAVMLWFANALAMVGADAINATMGRAFPTIALMVSMVMRLIPRFVEQGRTIEHTAQATTASRPSRRAAELRSRLRTVSVLMGWSLEDSLETADAMRARGWGASTKRTSYQANRFRRFDAMALAALAMLVGGAALVWWVEGRAFRFYPTLSPLPARGGYLLYGALMLVPLLISVLDDLAWKRRA